MRYRLFTGLARVLSYWAYEFNDKARAHRRRREAAEVAALWKGRKTVLYRVQPGDSAVSIARVVYGDARLFMVVQEAWLRTAADMVWPDGKPLTVLRPGYVIELRGVPVTRYNLG